MNLGLTIHRSEHAQRLSYVQKDLSQAIEVLNNADGEEMRILGVNDKRLRHAQFPPSGTQCNTSTPIEPMRTGAYAFTPQPWRQ